MRDLGGGIWVTDEALEKVGRLDTVVFDVDGVLIDVSRSFRVCICRAAQFYLESILGWDAQGEYVQPADTELFKRAGGFNSDWSLTDGATLLCLVKGVDAVDRRAATLRAAPPSLEEYTAAIGHGGGGLDAALDFLRGVVAPETLARALHLWDRDILRQLFCEYYAGRSQCLTVYGFEAEYVDFDDGELTRENVLVDASLLPRAWKYGIVTGRDRGEFMAGLPLTRMESLVPLAHTLTADDGLHKPDPEGLLRMADMLRPTVAAYVGDTVDDMRTVLNYRKVRATPPFLACQVLTGPAGERNRQFFADEGADVIAPDVNSLIQWLAERAAAPEPIAAR